MELAVLELATLVVGGMLSGSRESIEAHYFGTNRTSHLR